MILRRNRFALSTMVSGGGGGCSNRMGRIFESRIAILTMAMLPCRRKTGGDANRRSTEPVGPALVTRMGLDSKQFSFPSETISNIALARQSLAEESHTSDREDLNVEAPGDTCGENAFELVSEEYLADGEALERRSAPLSS
jgi:hypothetical protein